jgi:hypothetical protein
VLDAFFAVQDTVALVLVVSPEGADTSVTVGGWTADVERTTFHLVEAFAELRRLTARTTNLWLP